MVSTDVDVTLSYTFALFGYQPFQESRYVAVQKHGAFVMQKHKAWQFEVRQKLNHLVEGGCFLHLISTFQPSLSAATDTIQMSRIIQVQEFTVEHITGALLALLIGLGLSILMHILELCSFYKI